MTAARLREAAKVLRERAEKAPGGPWTYHETGTGNPSDGPTGVAVRSMPFPDDDGLIGAYDSHDGNMAIYVATVGPDAGLALANALDSAADYDDSCDDNGSGECMRADLVHVADLILGGAE